MNKFQKTRHALSRLLDRMVIRLIGHKCDKCGSRNTQHGHYWARGWNNLCQQAYGDWGAHCNKCHHITWDTPLAEHMATLPNWCKPYNAKSQATDAALSRQVACTDGVRQRFSEDNMNEWQQEWQPTDHDKRLHELATRYHTECEAYDQTVCTGPKGQDGIMPANQREMALINRNAHAVRKRLTEEAAQEGIEREELARAISKWHGSLPNAE